MSTARALQFPHLTSKQAERSTKFGAAGDVPHEGGAVEDVPLESRAVETEILPLKGGAGGAAVYVPHEGGADEVKNGPHESGAEV